MMSRKFLIVSFLFLIGAFSFLWQIKTDPSISLENALLALGIECLKTAVFFILLDLIIAEHDKRKESLTQARGKIVMVAGDNEMNIKSQFDRLEVNGQIKLDLQAGTDFSQITITSRKFRDCMWVQILLEETNFVDCSFIDSSFVDALLGGSVWENIVFESMKFDRCDIQGAMFKNCRFEHCSFSNIVSGESRFVECFFDNNSSAGLHEDGISLIDCVEQS